MWHDDPAVRADRVAAWVAWAGTPDTTAGRQALKASSLRVYVGHVNDAYRRANGVAYAPDAPRVTIVLRALERAAGNESAASLPLPLSALRSVATLEPALHAAVVIAFLCMLRVGEYTYRAGRSRHMLLARDVALTASGSTPAVRVALETRKHNTQFATILTRAANPALGDACPVAAFTRYLATHAARARAPDDPVFVRGDGTPVSPSDVSRAVQFLARQLAHSGTLPAHLLPRFTPHSLRKGGATALFTLGVDILTIQQQGGWKNQSTMLIYCRAHAGSDAGLSGVFARALADAPVIDSDSDSGPDAAADPPV